jgi:hypothetical protein
MSRKVLGKTFSFEKEAEEKEKRRKDPPRNVPWSKPNTNEMQATGWNTTQCPGTSDSRRMVSSARFQDTSPGAEPLSRPGRHHPVFIEEECPGAVVVPGFDDEEEAYYDDGLTVEEEYKEQVTIAPHEESIFHIIARTVDTEEENRRLRELDQAVRERDQLRQILEDAVIVSPILATNSDVENGNRNIHANHSDLPRSDVSKCGTRGRRWFVITAILLIMVTITVALALVLPPEPTPLQGPLSELLSSASSDGGVALADPSTPQNMALKWLSADPNLFSYTANETIQRYALATLYYSTKGESWYNNDYWLSPDEGICGRWYQYPNTTIKCTTEGAVSFLDIRDNNLQGSIPPEISMLSDSLSKGVTEKDAVKLCVITSHD